MASAGSGYAQPHDQVAGSEQVEGLDGVDVGLGDVLDALGRVHQFLPPAVQPLLPDVVVVGRAMTVLVADVFGPQEKPFGRLTEALDALKADDVYLARRAPAECAAWGEILTAAARTRGAIGAVVNGYHRDTRKVLEQDFPVFSRGAYGQDAGFAHQCWTTG